MDLRSIILIGDKIDKIDFRLIFKTISKDDCLFYKSLFKYYEKEIKESDLNLLVMFAIEFNCQLFLIQLFQDIPTYIIESSRCIFSSFSNTKTSYGMVKLIIDQIVKQNLINNFRKEFKQMGISIQQLLLQIKSWRKLFKILNLLIQSQLFEEIDYKTNISLSQILKSTTNKRSHNSSVVTIGELIQVCHSILLLPESSSSTTVMTFDKFESIISQFTKSELKLKLKNVKQLDSNQLKLVEELIQIYISIDGQQISYLYYSLFLQDNEETENKIIQLASSENYNSIYFIQSLKFGDYRYWEGCYKFGINARNVRSISDMLVLKETPNHLFKYCKNDKSKQLESIKRISECIYGNSESVNLFAFLLIEFDNIELLQYYINQLNKYINSEGIDKTFKFNYDQMFFSLSIQRFIRSIEMLKFCFQSIQFKPFFQLHGWSFYYFYKFNNLELLIEFENLLKQDNDNGSISSEKPKFRINGIELLSNIDFYQRNLQMVKYLVDNKNNYIFDSNFVISMLQIPREGLSNEQVSKIILEIQYIIEKGNFQPTFPNRIVDPNYFPKHNLDFVNWLNLNISTTPLNGTKRMKI